MKVNGIMIREAMKRWELRKEIVVKQFNNSFFAKPSEMVNKDSETPEELMKEMQLCEDSIAVLQVLQTRYNLETSVSFMYDGKVVKMSLTEAVKRIGGAGRMESMWRVAASQTSDPDEHNKLIYGDKNVEWKKRVMPLKEVVKRAAMASSYAGALRGAIAQGNTREVDFSSEANPSLFE